MTIYVERTSLNGYRAVFSQIAAIIAAALPWTLVAAFADMLGSKKAGWSLTAALFGACAVFPILITWRTTRGRELHPEHVTVRIKDIIHGPFRNRTFLYTMGLYTAASVGLSSVGALMVYYMKYYMNFNETQESLAFLFLIACTILWIPVKNRLSFAGSVNGSPILYYRSRGWLILAVGVMALQQGISLI